MWLGVRDRDALTSVVNTLNRLRPSKSTAARQDNSNRAKQNLNVVPEAAILQVQQVQGYFAAEALDVVVISIDHLSDRATFIL